MTVEKANRLYEEMKPSDSVTAYIRMLSGYLEIVKNDIHTSENKGDKMLIAKMSLANIEMLNNTLLYPNKLPKRFEYDIDYIRMYALGIEVYDTV